MGRLFYSETLPELSIAAHVDCLWTVAVEDGESGAPGHWVFPDGCWTLSIGVTPAWYIHLRPPVALPYIARSTPGELVVGVRFRPGLRAPDLLNQARRKLCPAQSVQEMLSILTGIIRTCAWDRENRVDLMITSLRQNKGRLPVEHLAERMGISTRHLERLSRTHLGLPPKTFGRITRLQSVLRQFIANPDVPIVDIAADFGYADQTHMTRDFAELGHTTPLRYRRSLENVGFVLEFDSLSR